MKLICVDCRKPIKGWYELDSTHGGNEIIFVPKCNCKTLSAKDIVDTFYNTKVSIVYQTVPGKYTTLEGVITSKSDDGIIVDNWIHIQYKHIVTIGVD